MSEITQVILYVINESLEVNADCLCLVIDYYIRGLQSNLSRYDHARGHHALITFIHGIDYFNVTSMLTIRLFPFTVGILLLLALSNATLYAEFEYFFPPDSNVTVSCPSPLNKRSHSTSSFSLLSSHLKVTLTDPIHKQKRKRISINSLAEFLLPKIHKQLVNEINYFITADNGTFVYFDKKLRSWVLQYFKEDISRLSPKRGQRIPLSRCLSTVHGGEGYVAAQLDASVYAESTFNTPVEFILLASTTEVLASIGSGLSLGSAAGFTGSISCILGPGQYAQPYLYPYYFQVPEGQRIKAKYVENKGLELFGDWEETPSFLKIIASGLLECAIGNEPNVCDSIIPGLGVNLTHKQTK